MKESDNKKENLPNISYFKSITDRHSYCTEVYNDNLCIFKSLYDIWYLVYSIYERDIIFYDLVNDKIIGTIKKPYKTKDEISLIKHYFIENEKRDLLLTLCWYESIKLWDIKNYECLITINEYIFSGVCIMKDDGNYYLITKAPEKYSDKKVIKVYDLKGNRIKTIDKEDETNIHGTYYLQPYYDKKLKSNFLIIKSSLDIKSYYFKENKKYHTYKFLPLDKNNFIIEEFNDATKILASISEIILVFDFHSGDLLELIKIDNGNFINCLCFWNQFYLFAGCHCRNLQLIDYSCKKK